MVRSIPPATVSRLPIYLRSLSELPSTKATCSSQQLASLAGVNAAQVRKDLSALGPTGVRGVGYDVARLQETLRRVLGLTHRYAVAIVGAGNLGTALGTYPGFKTWGFEVVAVLDSDATKVGSDVAGVAVEPIADLERIVRQRDVTIAIIATPAVAAQEVSDRLTSAGVKSILNFAPAQLRVPEDVAVRRVHLSTELQILTFHLQRMIQDEEGPAAGVESESP